MMATISKNKNIELELKFPLLESGILTKELNKKAQSVSKDQMQIDTYFSPKDEKKDFISKNPVSEWLRVREAKGKVTVNYKCWHNKNNSKAISCDELETSVGDVETFKSILHSLHFRKIVVVEKKRNIWLYKKAEIAIDSVKDLGDFIEIEAKGEFDSVEKAEEYLFEILEELEALVGEQDYEGYPYKLLKKSGLIKITQ